MFRLFCVLAFLATVSSTTVEINANPYYISSWRVDCDTISSWIPDCCNVSTQDGDCILTLSAENNIIKVGSFALRSPEVSWRTYIICNGTESGYALAYFFGNSVIYASSVASVFPRFGVHFRNMTVTDTLGANPSYVFSFDDNPNNPNDIVFHLEAEQDGDLHGDLGDFLLMNRTQEFTQNNTGANIVPVYHPKGIFSDQVKGKTTLFQSTIVSTLSSGVVNDPSQASKLNGEGQSIWVTKTDEPTVIPGFTIACS